MSHYKVREIHPDWLREDSTEVDERSRILVEELNRKLTERECSIDLLLVCLPLAVLPMS